MNGGGGQRSSSSGTSTGTNFNSYSFDFGLPTSRSSSSQPLRGNPSPVAAPSSAPSWSYQPASRPVPAGRPSWTHQPAAKPTSNPSAGPTSMVGDIFGKTWSSSSSSSSSVATAGNRSNTSSLGIPQNNPNLFGDLFASALGSGTSSARGSGAPLKSAGGSTQKTSFSMNNLADSLPKSTDPGANFAAFGQSRGANQTPIGSTNQPMRSATGSFGSAPSMGQKKDPFDSLTGFGSTQKPAMKSNPAPANAAQPDLFGSANPTNPTQFNAFPPPPQPQPQTFTSTTTTAKSSPVPNHDMDFFTSKATPTPPPPANETNDWDLGAQFAAADDGSMTTELEGLPPPPAGLTGAAAKSKGMDNYKQGQYPDAIKWLSWALIILEKQGDQDAVAEVLTSRASSYKEVGEYKKAIADCSKVLEQDKENVSVLIQRALLYESNEKYRLGAEDLRMVLKIDPGNRLARSTIHRLQKMAD